METWFGLPSQYSNKGYALILDAILAVLLFTAIYGMASQFSANNQQSSVSNVSVQKMLNDSLDELDQRNALQTLNMNLVQQLLNQSLPKNITWGLTIIEYEFNGNAFQATQQWTAGNKLNEQTHSLNQAGRMFLRFQDGKIYRYYWAELEAGQT